MILIGFTPQDIDALHHPRFHHPHPRVQLRMEAVYLKSQGRPHQEICRLVRISENTLRSYLRQYQEGGIERLKRIDWAGATSELDEHRPSLADYFREHPPRSTAEAAAAIERRTGIRRGQTPVRRFLKGMGLKFRKRGMIPAKADADEQAKFLDGKVWPRRRPARRLRRAVCFVDAAHFVHGAFLGALWGFVRLVGRGPSGRKRFNGRGAIDAITHELTTVVNDTVIDATAVCELLRTLAGRYAGLPLTRVLDNARSPKCEVVRRLAAELGIELLSLPSDAPNLNRIERLWKFVKKEVLTCRSYEDFSRFQAAIVECLEGVEGKHKAAIASLLTLNFQTFEQPQVLAA